MAALSPGPIFQDINHKVVSQRMVSLTRRSVNTRWGIGHPVVVQVHQLQYPVKLGGRGGGGLGLYT